MAVEVISNDFLVTVVGELQVQLAWTRRQLAEREQELALTQQRLGKLLQEKSQTEALLGTTLQDQAEAEAHIDTATSLNAANSLIAAAVVEERIEIPNHTVKPRRGRF